MKTKKKPGKPIKKEGIVVFVRNEEKMVEWLRENPIVLDSKRSDYKKTQLKNRLWEEQGTHLRKDGKYCLTCPMLQGVGQLHTGFQWFTVPGVLVRDAGGDYI